MTTTGKFFLVKLEETFYLDETPKAQPGAPEPTLQVVMCKKASAVSYINVNEPVLGEISYTPDIERKILTEAEYQAKTAPAPKKAAKKAPAKKSAKKPVAKKSTTAIKSVKKRNTATKAVKRAKKAR